LLLLNNDVVLFPDALDKMIDYAECHSNVTGVQGVILSQEQAFWIPPGFAHGFQALEDTYLLYMVTKEYFPQHERYIDWCDSEIGVNWQIKKYHSQ
jgi:dTDP-4-dehydrorhamnose 3,5-epimerase-like enzyme